MTTLVKTTLDGRKVEIIGQAVMLAGKLEAMELIPIKDHPNRFNILSVMPDAAYMAGRIALTEEEAKIALDALAKTIRFNFPRFHEVVFYIDGQVPQYPDEKKI